MLSLWLFDMQAAVLNLMQTATGNQCKEIKRGVALALLGSMKTSRDAAF